MGRFILHSAHVSSRPRLALRAVRLPAAGYGQQLPLIWAVVAQQRLHPQSFVWGPSLQSFVWSHSFLQSIS